MMGGKATCGRMECSAVMGVQGLCIMRIKAYLSMKINKWFYNSKRCITSLFEIYLKHPSVPLRDIIILIQLLDRRGTNMLLSSLACYILTSWVVQGLYEAWRFIQCAALSVLLTLYCDFSL